MSTVGQGAGQEDETCCEPKCECSALLCCQMRLRLECRVRMDTASWRAAAFSCYAYLRDEFARLDAMTEAKRKERPKECPKDKRPLTGVERALDEALLAMTDARRWRCEGCCETKHRWRRWRPWRAIKRFYSGSDIEQAWRAIHRAQAALYAIYPKCELVPQTEHVETMIADLPDQATLLKSITKLLSQLTEQSASEASGGTGHRSDSQEGAERATEVATATTYVKTAPGVMLRGIYERAMDVSDNLQREARSLRNAMMVTSGVSLLVLVGLGVAHLAHHGQIIELCTKSTNGAEVCPVDEKPHAFGVFAIELAGLLGGLLSILIPLATGERIKTPYRVFNQQLVLKLVAGAASALGGILLIESGVISTIKLETSTAIFGYAVFFGFAQQVVTGAVDRRADALAKQTPTAKSV